MKKWPNKQHNLHIQVSFYSCSLCSRVSGSWWGWQSPELFVVNPRVLFHHHIGKDWACIAKSASSDNNSTSQTMWPCGGSKGSSHGHLPAITSECRSIEIQSCGTHDYMKVLWTHAAKFDVLPSYYAMMENKGTANFFLLTSLVSTGRGRDAYYSWTTCCRKWTHDCWWLKIAQYIIPKQLMHLIPETTRSAPRQHVWRSASTIKPSRSLEGKIGNDECRWETTYTRQRDSSIQSGPIYLNMYHADVCIDSHDRALSSQCGVL